MYTARCRWLIFIEILIYGHENLDNENKYVDDHIYMVRSLKKMLQLEVREIQDILYTYINS